MNYGAERPAMNQINSSMQQSFLPVMHQQTYCQEMSAAEMVSQYGVTDQNPYNPETSDFLFPGRPPIEENESQSIHLQHTTGASTVIVDQNYQYRDALIPEHTPMSIADCNSLPGFQQTFGQRNALKNRMVQHPTAPSQMECSGVFRTNEVSSRFPSTYNNFGLSGYMSTNETMQYSGMALETPILNIQHAQYSTRNPIHPINFIEQKQTFPFEILTCDDPLENVPFCINSLRSNKEENIFENNNPNNITDAISLPSTSQISMEYQESPVANLDAIKFKEDEYKSKHKKLADFSYGTAESFSNPSNATQIRKFNFGIGANSNKIEPCAFERSGLVTCSLENHQACNISLTSINLDATSGNAKKQLYKYCKDRKSYIPLTDHPEFLNPSRTFARPYKCNFCAKSYANKSHLSRHVRTHIDDKPYKCTECGKCFYTNSKLRVHSRTHTGEKPYSCGECGKCFSTDSQLHVHFRIHTGEKPYSCGECGKGLSTDGQLCVHCRTHTGEKPYACNECSKRYFQNVNLICHMHKHADEERRKCDSCGAEFSSEDSPAAHQCRENK
ncbi:hypothetical protein CEXT_705161 [Caerostris extrusa]|uniref:C2H2-type domain-containing protein n=1 Tax=Caerostris extrusa TaxID=172846 RepID=A0AAV4VWB2_CAEEX|nr:hypothetical protein CEXT_705161 [Caerostris extrusa]